MAFIAAVVASARSPAKIANIALPPEKGETFAASLACNACTHGNGRFRWYPEFFHKVDVENPSGIESLQFGSRSKG